MRLFLAVAVVAALLPVFQAQDCREYASCSDCLADPQCGWCADTDACVPGNSQGPSTGTCTTWDFHGCPTTPISTPSATPSAVPSFSPSPTPSVPPPPPPPFSLGEDWPMFGGGASRDGSRSRPNMEVSDFTVGWRANFGGASSAAVLCDGMLLATLFSFQTQSANLSALDGTTGEKLFVTKLGDASSVSPPACGKGVAYIQVIGANEGLFVYAVNLTSGVVMWKASGSSQWASYQYGVLPHPNGLIYAPGGAFNGEVYAINDNGTNNYTKALYATSFGCDSWSPTAWPLEKEYIYWVTMPGEGPNTGLFGENNAIGGAKEYQLTLAGDWDGYSTQSCVAVSSKGTALTSLRNDGISVSAIDINKHEILWNYTDCKSTKAPTGGFYDQTLSTDGEIAAMTCGNGILVFDLKTGELQQNLYCPDCGGQPIITPQFMVASGGGTTFIVPRGGDNVGKNIELSAGGAVLISGTAVIVTNMQDGSVAAFELLE